MKTSITQKLLHFFAGILFIALLLAPLGAIYAITELEMEQYNDVFVPGVVEKSYGDPLPVVRMDMQEFITVSGTYVSTEEFFMELPTLKNVYTARMLAGYGDYVEVGDIIGYTEDGKTEILSTESGVIKEISLGKYSYILMESVEELGLRCFLKDETLNVMQRDTLALTDTDGNPVELIKIGKFVNESGETEVLIKMPKGRYAVNEKDIKLYTGKVYTKALVVPTGCLFQLPEDPKTWYVRIVDANKNVIGNQAVQIGFSDGEYTCVTGLEEGTLLDSGYARILRSK